MVSEDYYYQNEPAKIDGSNRAIDVAARKDLVADSLECLLLGKPASDIFTCDKLLNGVTLPISFRGSPGNFTVKSESKKHYIVKIVEAKIYVRKMTVADHVLSAIENTLVKTLSVYRYTEVLPRTFLANVGIRSWSQEDISKEPVQRIIIAMSTTQ